MPLCRFLVNFVSNYRTILKILIAFLLLFLFTNSLDFRLKQFPGYTLEEKSESLIYITIKSDIDLLNSRTIGVLKKIEEDLLSVHNSIESVFYFKSYINKNSDNYLLEANIPDYLLSDDNKNALMIVNIKGDRKEKEQAFSKLDNLMQKANYTGLKKIEHFQLCLSGLSLTSFREKKFFENEMLILTILVTLVVFFLYGFIHKSIGMGLIAGIISYLTILMLMNFYLLCRIEMYVGSFVFIVFSIMLFTLIYHSMYSLRFNRLFQKMDDRKEASALSLKLILSLLLPSLLFFIIFTFAITVFYQFAFLEILMLNLALLISMPLNIIVMVLYSTAGLSLGRYKSNNLPDKGKYDDIFKLPKDLIIKHPLCIVIVLTVFFLFLALGILNYSPSLDYSSNSEIPYLKDSKIIADSKMAGVFPVALVFKVKDSSHHSEISNKIFEYRKDIDLVEIVPPVKSLLDANKVKNRMLYEKDKNTISITLMLNSISLKSYNQIKNLIEQIQKKYDLEIVQNSLEEWNIFKILNIELQRIVLFFPILFILIFLALLFIIKDLKISAAYLFTIFIVVLSFYGIISFQGCETSFATLHLPILLLLMFVLSIVSFHEYLREIYEQVDFDFDKAFAYTMITERMYTSAVVLAVCFGGVAYSFSVHKSFDNISEQFLYMLPLLLAYNIFYLPSVVFLLKERIRKERTLSQSILEIVFNKVKVDSIYDKPFKKESDYKYIANEYNHFIKKMVLMSVSIIMFFVLLFSASKIYNLYKDYFYEKDTVKIEKK